MDALVDAITNLMGGYAGIFLAVVGACAIICMALPAPDATTSWGKIYYPIYQFLQWWAANKGYSANADDVAKKASGNVSQ